MPDPKFVWEQKVGNTRKKYRVQKTKKFVRVENFLSTTA